MKGLKALLVESVAGDKGSERGRMQERGQKRE